MATKDSGTSKSTSTQRSTSTNEVTPGVVDGLTDAQKRADDERRQWEEQMEAEAREAEKQHDSAPRP